MKNPSRLKASLLLGTLLTCCAASAADVKIYPYDGAQLLAGQKFDLRVEVGGTTPDQEAAVLLDGQPLTGMTKTSSAPQSVEYTVRGLSLPAGNHTVTVTGAGTGAASMTAVAPAAAAQAKKVILFIGDGMGWNTVRAAELVAQGYNPANGMPQWPPGDGNGPEQHGDRHHLQLRFVSDRQRQYRFLHRHRAESAGQRAERLSRQHQGLAGQSPHRNHRRDSPPHHRHGHRAGQHRLRHRRHARRLRGPHPRCAATTRRWPISTSRARPSPTC